MAAFSDLMTIANDAGFQGRVKYALQVAAVNVMAEAGNTANHAQRVGFSTHVLQGSIRILEVAVAVLSNPAIATEANTAVVAASGFSIPDADIQFAINSLYSTLAGVPAN